MDDREAILRQAFKKAVAAVSAEARLPAHLPPPSSSNIHLIAVGKAAAAMAEVAADHLDVKSALVVFPDGHGPSRPIPSQFELITAGHPVPDERSVRAADRALEFAAGLSSHDLMLALISGGGSALMAAPVDGVSLDDKQALTRALLGSGATIADMNCVRQCLSRIKGGRLARATKAQVLTLVISDIPGDDLRLVASGPTLPSSATLEQAKAILGWYRFDVAPGIKEALDNPANAPVATLPNARGELVASPRMALEAAARYLEGEGYRPLILGDAIEGEARELARLDAKIALEHVSENQRTALVIGGEGTVRLPPNPPPGGRNTEYALALAIELDHHPGIRALACDSDGIDGSTPAAGAVVGPRTLSDLSSAGLDPQACLEAHDAFEAFRLLDALVTTGPTRTNVNDIRLILIDRE